MSADFKVVVEEILNDAKVRFDKWVKRYYPWVGPNHTTERNLSFQFATAFLKLHPEGLAFFEVPFSTPPSTRNINHLDAYLYTSQFAILLECKNLFGTSHLKSINTDIDRINTSLVTQIHKRNEEFIPKTYSKPANSYGVILVETWYPYVACWWKNREGYGVKSNWKDSKYGALEGWTRDCIEVLKVDDSKTGTLFWLYAISGEL